VDVDADIDPESIRLTQIDVGTDFAVVLSRPKEQPPADRGQMLAWTSSATFAPLAVGCGFGKHMGSAIAALAFGPRHRPGKPH
jgi:hypothetical protein